MSDVPDGLPNHTHLMEPVSVAAGDRFMIDVYLDFGVTLRWQVVYLAGIDCPEPGTPAGASAVEFTLQWLQDPARRPLTVELLDPDEEGPPWHVEVYDHDLGNLGDDLITEGHAVMPVMPEMPAVQPIAAVTSIDQGRRPQWKRR